MLFVRRAYVMYGRRLQVLCVAGTPVTWNAARSRRYVIALSASWRVFCHNNVRQPVEEGACERVSLADRVNVAKDVNTLSNFSLFTQTQA